MQKVVSTLILLCFIVTGIIGPLPIARADDFLLPQPGVMVHLSPPFEPPILKGIKVHPDNPFRFDFILDKGDSKLNNDQLKNESTRLIKYFLASLTIPEKDLWVNLSPYEKDRIVPDAFGQTEMGRDLLAEDYMLKQITASLIYPEDKIGKEFWDKVYAEAMKRYGTTNVPVNTFNKVWIVPEKATVYENKDAAFVVESKLKVMLEQDYLSLEKHDGIQSVQAQVKDTNQLGSQIVREIIIPALEKEVNEGKNFTQLRQVYNSLILATWFKHKIKDSIMSRAYVDQKKTSGIDVNDKQANEKIYLRYLRAFKKGAYNYIKEDYDQTTKQSIPRKYFSGGADLDKIEGAYRKNSDIRSLPRLDNAMIVEVNAKPVDMAMQGRVRTRGLTRNVETVIDAPNDDIFSSIVRMYKRQLQAQKTDGDSFFRFTEKGNLVTYGVLQPSSSEVRLFQGEVPMDVLKRSKLLYILNIGRANRPGNLGADPSLGRADENDSNLWRLVYDTAKKLWPNMFSVNLKGPSGNSWYISGNNFPSIPPKVGKWFSAPEIYSLILARAEGRVHQSEMSRFENIFDTIHFLIQLNNSKSLDENLFRLTINGTYYSDDILAPNGGATQLQAHAQLNRLPFGIELAKEKFEGKVGDVKISTLMNWPATSMVFESENQHYEETASLVAQAVKIITDKGHSFNLIVTPVKKNGIKVYVNDRVLWVPRPYFSQGFGFAQFGGSIVLQHPEDFFEMSDEQVITFYTLTFDEKIAWISEGIKNRTLRVKPDLITKTEKALSIITAKEEEIDGIVNLLLKNRAMTVDKNTIISKRRELHRKDSAITNTGGIDFNSDKMNLNIQNGGNGIKFSIDPAQLEQIRNASGFTPVIINFQPMTDLQMWFGLRKSNSSAVS